MPKAWSIEELRRFEEIKEGLRSTQERHTPARQRSATPARARRAAARRASDDRGPRAA